MKFSKTKTLLAVTIFLTLVGQESHGQGLFGKKNNTNQYTSIGFGGGTSNYFGDLSPYSTFYYGLMTNVRWNATINYTKYITPNFGLRFGFTWARIAGDDFSYSQHNLVKFENLFLRNLHFRNDIKEFTIQGIVNLIPQSGRGPQSRTPIIPYAFFGLGFYGHNPEARAVADDGGGGKSPGAWVSLRDYQTGGQDLGSNYPKSYSLVQVVAPVGLGARLRINDKFDFCAEIGFRITPTDYLDDVGNDKYANPNDFPNPASIELANRSTDDFDARTGQSRIPQFQQVLVNRGYANATGKPSDFLGAEIVGYNNGDMRGGPRWDSYLLTQFTLHYIISNEVKCPPVR